MSDQTGKMLPTGRGAQTARYSLSALGLRIECDWPLPGSVPVGQRDGSPPTTRVGESPGAAIDVIWREPAEQIFEQRLLNGRESFAVERTGDHYRLQMNGYGRYLVTVDGGQVACECGAASRSAQERFLFARALPVAAVLRGYDLLHAGAVAAGRAVVAFMGESGSGKTTTVAALVGRGAPFVTDDVLAVELRQSIATVHPGPSFMTIRSEDAHLIGGALGKTVGSSDKLHVSPPAVGDALPLAAVYHLSRGANCRIEPLNGIDTLAILGNAFLPYITTPKRLRQHLEVAQLLGSTIAAYSLQTPSGELDDATLSALEAHIAEHAC